jgi:hypothetical protein
MDCFKTLRRAIIVCCCALSFPSVAARVPVSPLMFQSNGWSLDTQFTEAMGSPYLLAHGLGRRVSDAHAKVSLPSSGRWRVWVRAKNWLPEDARADQSDAACWPCAFKVLVNGRALERIFGCGRRGWAWEDGGEIELNSGEVRIALYDLSGFDARCAGIMFERGAPPADGEALYAETAGAVEHVDVDFVVVGGGMAGCSAAVAAARRGLKVALLQDRPVLGGNASAEIRVWSAGEIRHPIVRELRGRFPIRDSRLSVSDDERLRIVGNETNIILHLETRAVSVEKKPNGAISSVTAVSLKDNRLLRFTAPYFCDSTGDGFIGAAAGALWRMGREGRDEYGEKLAPEKADKGVLGASIMWSSAESNDETPFAAPWAEPYARGVSAVHGEWFWEYGIGMDMITEAETVRDRLLLAIYGAFSTAKRDPVNSRHILDFCPYVLGKRESRRLIGDYVLTGNDIIAHREFEDAVATGSWALDSHVAGRKGFPNVDFVATSMEPEHFGRYWIPWRTLYSANVPNLLMAGRCFSATHVAFCSARVINTGAQMGVAVGTGTALCLEYGCSPADLLERSKMHRFQRILGGDWPGNPDPARTGWIYFDDEDENRFSFQGEWRLWYTPSGGQHGNLSHFSRESPGVVSGSIPVKEAGRYELYARYPYLAAVKKPSIVVYEIVSGGVRTKLTADMSLETGSWRMLGEVDLNVGARIEIDPSACTGSLVVDGFAIRKITRRLTK